MNINLLNKVGITIRCINYPRLKEVAQPVDPKIGKIAIEILGDANLCGNTKKTKLSRLSNRLISVATDTIFCKKIAKIWSVHCSKPTKNQESKYATIDESKITSKSTYETPVLRKVVAHEYEYNENDPIYDTIDESKIKSQSTYETPVLRKVVAHEYEYDKNDPIYTTTDEPESPSQPAYETPVLGKVVAHEYEYDENDPIYDTIDESKIKSQHAYETPVLRKVVAHEYEYDKNDPIYTTTDEPIYATID